MNGTLLLPIAHLIDDCVHSRDKLTRGIAPSVRIPGRNGRQDMLELREAASVLLAYKRLFEHGLVYEPRQLFGVE